MICNKNNTGVPPLPVLFDFSALPSTVMKKEENSRKLRTGIPLQKGRAVFVLFKTKLSWLLIF
jgi:hypothetical protein